MPEPSSEKPKRGRPKGSGRKPSRNVKRSGPDPSPEVVKAVRKNHDLFVKTNKQFKASFKRDLLNYWSAVKGFQLGRFVEEVLGASAVLGAVMASDKYDTEAVAVLAQLTGSVLPATPRKQKDAKKKADAESPPEEPEEPCESTTTE